MTHMTVEEGAIFESPRKKISRKAKKVKHNNDENQFLICVLKIRHHNAQ